MLIELDDWHENHANAAACQGWQIFDTGFLGQAPLEIRYLEMDPATDVEDKTVHCRDEEAVRSFREAFKLGEDHALVAFKLIRLHSPKEYEHWRMMDWI